MRPSPKYEIDQFQPGPEVPCLTGCPRLRRTFRNDETRRKTWWTMPSWYKIGWLNVMIKIYKDALATINRAFAIYLTLLGWKTYKYHWETDELTNPRPEKIGWKWYLGRFLPTANDFSWVGTNFIYETDCKNPQHNKILRQHPIVEARATVGHW